MDFQVSNNSVCNNQQDFSVTCWTFSLFLIEWCNIIIYMYFVPYRNMWWKLFLIFFRFNLLCHEVVHEVIKILYLLKLIWPAEANNVVKYRALISCIPSIPMLRKVLRYCHYFGSNISFWCLSVKSAKSRLW